MKKFFSLFVASFIFVTPVSAETISNVGFAPGNIWYSQEPFFAGEKIRVYTVLYNASDKDIKGDVVFYDNNTVIDRSAFSIAKGRVQDIWTDWTPAEGNHNVRAELENTRVTLPGGGESTITLANAITGESTRVVELDTDGDNIPNSQDPDDDNDGISDTSEIAAGTDPLKADSDNDGKSDREDQDPFTANLPDSEKLREVAESIKDDALPAATGVADAAYKKSEEIRFTLKDFAENKIAELEKEKADNPKEGSAAFTQAAALYGNYSLLYMARYQILFYGFFVLLIFLSGRWMWKRSFGDRFS